VLPDVDFTVPKSANSCVGNTITGKSSLILEQNISQKLWPWLQPVHKKVHGWRVLPMTYGHGQKPLRRKFIRNRYISRLEILRPSFLYFGFVPLLPEHHLLHVDVAHTVLSLEGSERFASEFSVSFQIFCDVAKDAAIS
jgi:hypothetical protein